MEWPQNTDTQLFPISTLLDIKMKAIEWEYKDGFIRRVKIVLNESMGATIPIFGENTKHPLPNRFDFPDNVQIKKVKIYSWGAHCGIEFFDKSKKSIVLIGARTKDAKILTLCQRSFIVGGKARGKEGYRYLCYFEFVILKVPLNLLPFRH